MSASRAPVSRDEVLRRLRIRVDLTVLVAASAAAIQQVATSSIAWFATGMTLALVACAALGVVRRATWTPAAYVALIVVANPVYLVTYGPLVGMGAIDVFAIGMAVVFLPRGRWVVVALLAAAPIAIGVLIAIDASWAPVVPLDAAATWWRTATAATAAMVAVAIVVGSAVRQLKAANLELEVALRSERAARAETERIERELARSKRAELIVELAAEVGAELGAALAAVEDRAAALARELDDEESRTCLEDVHAAAVNAGGTMRSLTVFSKDATEEDACCDAAQTARSLPQIVRRTIPEQISLEITTGDAAWVALSSTDLLRILGNLVINARDAIAGPGAITLDVGADQDAVVIVVRDDGAGMDDATLARLFQPFFTTKPVGRGTGLGLATTRVLLERAGGTISVESSPGRGASFTIRLPRVAARG